MIGQYFVSFDGMRFMILPEIVIQFVNVNETTDEIDDADFTSARALMRVAPHESYRCHAECNNNNEAIFSRQHWEMCHRQLDRRLHCP